MARHSFPAELYDAGNMPNGEPDICKALTRKGRQCRNPVFGSQIGSNAQEVVGYVDGWPAYRPIVTISQDEYETMIAGVCYIHALSDDTDRRRHGARY